MARTTSATTMDIDAANATGRRSLEELYVQYAPGAFRLALLLTGSRAEAEDVVQEAFVRVVGRLGHVRNVDAFDGYLRRTVVNLTKNTWRRRALERRHAEPVDVEQTARPTDAPVLERIVVFRALATLPSRQRIALALRYYEDLPVEEIASIMRCPSGTVRSLLSRGAAAMRTAMEDHDDA
jgi:RNA polymerase sigma-70 factor (sigma-E family)